MKFKVIIPGVVAVSTAAVMAFCVFAENAKSDKSQGDHPDIEPRVLSMTHTKFDGDPNYYSPDYKFGDDVPDPDPRLTDPDPRLRGVNVSDDVTLEMLGVKSYTFDTKNLFSANDNAVAITVLGEKGKEFTVAFTGPDDVVIFKDAGNITSFQTKVGPLDASKKYKFVVQNNEAEKQKFHIDITSYRYTP